MTIPKTQIRVFDDEESLAYAAAQFICTVAVEAVAARGRFLFALAGGGTPQGVYRKLGLLPFAASLPWSESILLWGDERMVPPHHAESNYGQVAELLLNQVAIPNANIRRVKGELKTAEALLDYAEELRQLTTASRRWPVLDLALLGMGRDGHTASLFPDSQIEIESDHPLLAVTADYDGRPADRISMTPQVFNDARHVLFLVTGADKAETLRNVFSGQYMPDRYPVHLIQPHSGRPTWYVDRAAASLFTTYT